MSRPPAYLSYLQNCFQTEDLRQGTTSVVPQMAHSNFPAIAAAVLQATGNK
jgi:thiaminase